jgi:hypothetical protein
MDIQEEIRSELSRLDVPTTSLAGFLLESSQEPAVIRVDYEGVIASAGLDPTGGICFRVCAHLENPSWWGVIRLVTRAATPTEIDSVGPLDVGMTLVTEASDCFCFHCFTRSRTK